MEPRYRPRILATTAGLMRSSSGAELRAAAMPKRVTSTIDTVIVPGGPGAWSRLAMTPRTFARFYRERTGATPARAVEQIRLERACAMIESRRTSIKAVAQQCGFSSEEVMRRTFLRRLHVSPMDYQKRFATTRDA